MNSVNDLPICELNISVRAYNALQRGGYYTIGDILSVECEDLPPIRGIGLKTWSQIIDAAKTLLQNHNHVVEDPPLILNEPPVFSFENDPIEELGFTYEIIEDLSLHGITTIRAFALLKLSELISFDILRFLDKNNWSEVFPKIRRYSWGNVINTVISRPCDDEEISILSLGLSNRVRHSLMRIGINSVDDLSRVTLANLVEIPNFGPKSLIEIINKFGQHLEDGKSIIRNKTESYQDVNQNISKSHLKEEIEKALQSLRKRDEEVIYMRYGIYDGQNKTLDEVGKILGITRERVRQIENRAFRHLKQQLQRPAIRQINELLYLQVYDAGGLLTETKMIEAVCDQFIGIDLNVLNLIHLLIYIQDELFWIKSIQSWCIPSFAKYVTNINSIAVEILKVEHAPLSWEAFQSRFRMTNWYQVHADQMNDNFIHTCIESGDRIVCYDNGLVGLEKWGGQYIDNLILALRRLGKPSHYTEITEIVNANLPPEKQIKPHSIHTKLMQHSEFFVWVRRRGVYGLKEWGLEPTLSYVDALEQILQSAKHPLTFQEILAQLPKIRPFYDETSILLTLGTNGNFRNFPGNTYGLTSWDEDYYITNDYRVKRLLQAGEDVSLKKPQKQVIEQLESVNVFIAQLRAGEC